MIRKKLYTLTIVLIMGIVGMVFTPSASASLKDGYLANQTGIGVGISTYPNYSGYNRIIGANSTYSNLNADPWPRPGDLTGIYVGPGWTCTVRQYSGRTGALLIQNTVSNRRLGVSYLSGGNIMTITNCHT